jgi:RNA recognition motif-containing protein
VNFVGGASSILSRLGGKDAGASPGTKILVKNLKFDILEEEVRELFGTVGEVSKAEIVYDRSGRSKGIARVWFTRRSDADKAIKQYDGEAYVKTSNELGSCISNFFVPVCLYSLSRTYAGWPADANYPGRGQERSQRTLWHGARPGRQGCQV